ncbi:hypothetical protein O6H91_Y416700 [Diphasiastrum complanatum]|nr:hypothetical protein O6H91_Y416700 [Diphasiastrum complanatum]
MGFLPETILHSLRRLHHSHCAVYIKNLVEQQKIAFGQCEISPLCPCDASFGLRAQVSTSGKQRDGVSSFKYRRYSSSVPFDERSMPLFRERKLVFVLGGPGSGKGTQCAKLAKAFGLEHLNVGDLLRAEINCDSVEGRAIQNIIKEGKIVPSQVTVNLLNRAMQDGSSRVLLVDGFPRSEENRVVYDKLIGIDPQFVLFLDCSLEQMEVRLLSRDQGRIDDNLDTIRKRFRVFNEVTLPVIEHYRSLGKLLTVNAARTEEEIFRSILPFFRSIDESLSVKVCSL